MFHLDSWQFLYSALHSYRETWVLQDYFWKKENPRFISLGYESFYCGGQKSEWLKDFMCPSWTPRSCSIFYSLHAKCYLKPVFCFKYYTVVSVIHKPNLNRTLYTSRPGNCFSKLYFCFLFLKKLSLQTEVWHLSTFFTYYVLLRDHWKPEMLCGWKTWDGWESLDVFTDVFNIFLHMKFKFRNGDLKSAIMWRVWNSGR